MKLNNGEIFASAEPLKKLLEVKLPVKSSLALARMANKLNEQLKIIEDVRNGLVRTYGKEDIKQKGQLRVDPEDENFSKFAEEFQELMNQEVEVVFDKVKLPEKVIAKCEKCEAIIEKPLEIEASVLMALEKFIEVE